MLHTEMNHEKLLEYLNQRLPFYLDLLQRMVDVNSFTSNPKGVNQLGQITARAFNTLGFKPEYIQSINPNFGEHVFLHYPTFSNQQFLNKTNKKSISLVSHLDTVFSPAEEKENNFSYHTNGNKIYGPGTVDIKGGTVMIFIVMEVFRKFFPQLFESVNWVVCLDASEETSSEDFGKQLNERIPPDVLACLIFEGGTPNDSSFPIVTSRKGRAEFLISADGRGAHAGNYHKQGANAIVQVADMIKQIASFTDYAQHITFNVGVVNGGSVVNRVPHHAEALVEMRAFSPEVFETGYQKMMSLHQTSTISSHDGFPCKVEVKCLSRTAPWPRNQRTDFLFKIWSDAAESLGNRVIPEERGGLSDGNLLWQTLPVLDGLGPSGTNAHCSESSTDGSKEQEYVLVTSFVPKALLNICALLRLIASQSGSSTQ